MKKIIPILASAAILLTLTACSGNNDKTPSGNNSSTQTNNSTQTSEPSSTVGNDSSTDTSEDSQVGGDVSDPQDIKPEIKSNGEFKYFYDDALNGIVIAGYEGEPTDIVIPDTIEDKPVVKIGDSAFKQDFMNNTGIKSIKIPDTVTVIGIQAFYNCAGITSIDIPDSVTTIDNAAFYSCESLTSIEIPDGVTTLGNSVFKSCTGLKSVKLPAGITVIERETFASCTSLESLDVPDGVTTILTYAFQYCASLTDLKLPDSVTELNGCNNIHTFDYCKKVKITYKGKVYDYDHLDDLHDAIYGE